MLKRTFIFLLCLIPQLCFANGGAFRSQPPVYTEHRLPPFNAVMSAGGVRVEITRGRRQSVRMVRNEQGANASARVEGGTLYVKGNGSKPVKVRLRDLQRVCATENSMIVGRAINSRHLMVEAMDRGSIYLRGKMPVSQIIQSSSGSIDIHWIDSKRLKIVSMGNGPVRLAGIARKVYARLNGKAKLDAKFLRTKHFNVVTQEHSVAKILPLYSLNAFAEDWSNIYYYKRPRYLSVLAHESGSVLPLHHLP